MPASVGLRPALIAATIGASLVGSSLLGTENGFGSLWLASNASLHLLIAASGRSAGGDQGAVPPDLPRRGARLK